MTAERSKQMAMIIRPPAQEIVANYGSLYAQTGAELGFFLSSFPLHLV